MKNEENEYNSKFSQYGWINHDSLTENIMTEALSKINGQDVTEAETYLVSVYRDFIRTKISEIIQTKPFSIRKSLFECAYNDYVNGRYHSSVPLAIIALDGTIMEIENLIKLQYKIEIKVFDKFANINEGNETVIKQFRKSRKKLNTESIDCVYRNGIMHGRDLNYNNEFIATKSFAIIIYIFEWWVTYRDGGNINEQ